MIDDLENVDLTLQVLKQLAGELLAGDGFDCYGNSRLLQAESAVTHGVRGHVQLHLQIGILCTQ